MDPNNTHKVIFWDNLYKLRPWLIIRWTSLHQLFSAPIGHSDLCGKATHRSETKSVCPKKKNNRNYGLLKAFIIIGFGVLWGLGVFIITFLTLSDAKNEQAIDPFDWLYWSHDLPNFQDGLNFLGARFSSYFFFFIYPRPRYSTPTSKTPRFRGWVNRSPKEKTLTAGDHAPEKSLE